jgi:hypothetical protein
VKQELGLRVELPAEVDPDTVQANGLDRPDDEHDDRHDSEQHQHGETYPRRTGHAPMLRHVHVRLLTRTAKIAQPFGGRLLFIRGARGALRNDSVAPEGPDRAGSESGRYWARSNRRPRQLGSTLDDSVGGLQGVFGGEDDDARPPRRTDFDAVDAQIRHGARSPSPASVAKLLRALADVLDGGEPCSDD